MTPVPSGAQVRRLTASIQGAREGRGLGSALSEVWYAAITLALSVALVVGAAEAVGSLVTPAPPGTVALAGAPAGLLVALAAAGALLGLAGRLGPVGVGSGGAAWWLPLPVDRRGLLRPAVLAWPAAAAVAGAVVLPLALGVLGTPLTPTDALVTAALGAGVAAALVAATAVLQGTRTGPRFAVAVGDGLALAAVLGLVAASLAAGVPVDLLPATGPTLVIAGALLVAAGVGTAVAERRSTMLDGARLRASGALGDRARVAVLSLDLRELGRALAAPAGGHGGAGGRARTVRSVRRVPHRAWAVLVVADALLLLRTRRALAQVLVAATLGATAGGVALLRSGLPLAAVWALTGFWAATSAAGGARHADLVPALDRVVPLAGRTVRLVRGVVPLGAAVVWAGVVLGSHALRTGDPLWLLLAVAWVPVLAAGAVRSAYRPPPRWERRAVVTPMGGVPATGGAFHGLDLVIIGTLPTALALHLGAVTPTLVVGQLVVAAIAVAVHVALIGRRAA